VNELAIAIGRVAAGRWMQFAARRLASRTWMTRTCDARLKPRTRLRGGATSAHRLCLS
jgi:hypothetical protein